ncbi:MAG: hypothetical protein Q8936_23305 [Bacillota bacterium]|nr:hypothetical protein [Bacillota bacterium]
MNMYSINADEVLKAKLLEKQSKVIYQIDEQCRRLFNARMKCLPEAAMLATDEQISTKINELLELKKKCINLDSFGNVDSSILDTYEIDYKA